MPKLSRRLSEAGITAPRLQELKGYCLQYPRYKRELAEARAGIVDRPNRRSGAWHRPDPTGNAAMAIADHPAQKRVALIERCANRVAEPVVAAALLKNVTEDVNYSKLRPPCGPNQFYVIRQLFFIELDRELWFTEFR